MHVSESCTRVCMSCECHVSQVNVYVCHVSHVTVYVCHVMQQAAMYVICNEKRDAFEQAKVIEGDMKTYCKNMNSPNFFGGMHTHTHAHTNPDKLSYTTHTHAHGQANKPSQRLRRWTLHTLNTHILSPSLSHTHTHTQLHIQAHTHTHPHIHTRITHAYLKLCKLSLTTLTHPHAQTKPRKISQAKLTCTHATTQTLAHYTHSCTHCTAQTLAH